ncbi:hypothetical protein GO001_00995 [Streptomyces sp. NRRL B-1677]|uniref:Carrier domain-containing protein n=1 Tax=Streptomyces klenkii TaxID=1420899 RepID=A0A3B0AWL3_9ACTN|nr:MULTISPECIES: phosphopantetheine-binding protein [Streptomyces]MBF6043795.1 hypothetical protein [Streptomyces sp. NRRL B-1677]RKN64266.1 hypothetical protein D7231_29255 [Streptomyces klenkii]
MTDVLDAVTQAIINIRPDLAESRAEITRDSAIFYAADPGRPMLGLDSMEALELIAVLEEEFGIQLGDTSIRIVDLRTVGDVVDAMSAAL